jgi:hypothetical protein
LRSLFDQFGAVRVGAQKPACCLSLCFVAVDFNNEIFCACASLVSELYHSIEIEPTAERIAAIRDYRYNSQPNTVGELRSFLVLTHKIAEINLLHTAASNLHTSGSNVEWTPELSTAFVKDTASKPETLVPFDETHQVFLLCARCLKVNIAS